MAFSQWLRCCCRFSQRVANLYLCLFIFSNLCTGMVVFFGFYFSINYSNTVASDKVGRQLLVDINHPLIMEDIAPSPFPPSPTLSNMVMFYSFSKSRAPLPANFTANHGGDFLCRLNSTGMSTAPISAKKPPADKSLGHSVAAHLPSNLSSSPEKASHSDSLKRVKKEVPNLPSDSLTRVNREGVVLGQFPSNNITSEQKSSTSHQESNFKHKKLKKKSKHKSTSPIPQSDHAPSNHSIQSQSSHAPSLTNQPGHAPEVITHTKSKISSEYVPYIIGITPTYYRMTQKLDLTSLCQTLMNVPRLLWIVVEDANATSKQVRDILSHCRVESILLHAVTTPETKKAKQKGVDQRNLAMDWVRDRCKACKERGGICEGVVYFMDDDNTFDIRLFEKIRWTRKVSVFPVGFVAGLKFEGPVCKDGKVERWQVQYAPKRHIPVDMAAFAVNVKLLSEHPKVRMGFKPDKVKRSTPGYLEPDFLKSLGAHRNTVECRGANDEILVWHVKSTYKKLIHENKHPSDPKVKV